MLHELLWNEAHPITITIEAINDDTAPGGNGAGACDGQRGQIPFRFTRRLGTAGAAAHPNYHATHNQSSGGLGSSLEDIDLETLDDFDACFSEGQGRGGSRRLTAGLGQGEEEQQQEDGIERARGIKILSKLEAAISEDLAACKSFQIILSIRQKQKITYDQR